MKRYLVPCMFGAALATFLVSHLQLPSFLSAQPQGPVGGPPQDSLLQLSERFETIAHRILPTVVAVEAVKPPSNTGKKPLEESGSGVIVRLDAKPGYYVVTNNHVIAGAKNDQITVHLADGRIYRPLEVMTDPESDLALLAIDGVNLPVAPLGNSDGARVGRWVLAIGSPFGLNQTVTHGIISARDRGQVTLGGVIRIKEFLQTDAAINPGSSGGPLIDMNGEVIGINTAIASHSGSNSGVAFSIPINLVKRLCTQLLTQGVVQRGFLGLQLSQNFEAKDALNLGMDRLRGAFVERIFPETPAADAGLQVKDVILQVDNVAIRDDTQFINLISSLPAGQRIRLQIWRDRSYLAMDAVVGDWTKSQNKVRTMN